MNIIYCAVLIASFIIIRLLNKQAWGALLSIVLYVIAEDITGDDSPASTFRLITYISFLYMTISDARCKGNDSVFVKYNMFAPNNKVPKKVVFWFGILGFICSILKVIQLL